MAGLLPLACSSFPALPALLSTCVARAKIDFRTASAPAVCSVRQHSALLHSTLTTCMPATRGAQQSDAERAQGAGN
eukprot:scaffold52594_cov19-Tisochrysis_lutea.AAC.4